MGEGSCAVSGRGLDVQNPLKVCEHIRGECEETERGTDGVIVFYKVFIVRINYTKRRNMKVFIIIAVLMCTAAAESVSDPPWTGDRDYLYTGGGCTVRDFSTMRVKWRGILIGSDLVGVVVINMEVLWEHFYKVQLFLGG